jgi:hypothetical protein
MSEGQPISRRACLEGVLLVTMLVELPLLLALLMFALLVGRLGWSLALVWAFIAVYVIDALFESVQPSDRCAYLLARLAPVIVAAGLGLLLRPLGSSLAAVCALTSCMGSMILVAKLMGGRELWPGWVGTFVMLIVKFLAPLVAVIALMRSPTSHIPENGSTDT